MVQRLCLGCCLAASGTHGVNGITTDKEPQNHCATTCSIAKDPPTLLQETNRQDGCRSSDGCRWCCLDVGCSIDANGLAASGILRGKGIRANREPSGKDRKPLPLWYLNPRSERNRSQQRAAKPLRYNLQYSERPTDFVTGNQQARRLPFL